MQKQPVKYALNRLGRLVPKDEVETVAADSSASASEPIAETQEDSDQETAADIATDKPEEPIKRKRGRPRKVAAPSDFEVK